jgi:hypothetical protein
MLVSRSRFSPHYPSRWLNFAGDTKVWLQCLASMVLRQQNNKGFVVLFRINGINIARNKKIVCAEFCYFVPNISMRGGLVH